VEGRAAVEAWQKSGLPLQRFARESGLPWWRLRWWWKKLGAPRTSAGKRKRRARACEKVRFIPAVVTGAAISRDTAVVIRFPDGLEVEVRHGDQPKPEEIARLVAELRRAGA
jgi:hypothetical protein